MISTTSFIAGVQILTTIAIIVIPVFTEHKLNPFQRRARNAIDRLRQRNDEPFDLIDISAISEQSGTTEEELLKIIAEELDIDLNNLRDELDEENVLQEIEMGYVQKGDPGFGILLDAISQNRSLKDLDVTTIGMIYGRAELFEVLDWNDSMPRGAKTPIGPNAALFVDYDSGLLPQRELIIYYPESPSLTLSLHELEIWVKDALRRKSHFLITILAIGWATTSVISLRL
ncbi:hypothetical protein [Natronorubrum halophilum]|uniref:hypothetical protein n=1 Tax=Natronorubrum halophilum TaxID=1702106 RepID=UPI0013CEF0AF|nr:hypothetical protein [Natronorubrum halophilum]